MPRYVVAAIHDWNRAVFDSHISRLPGEWEFIGDRAELTLERLSGLDPRYVFFLHWSWLVPESIWRRFECVAFHMTDLPFGRGGSPLQNLILRGLKDTRLTAFRMTGQMDAGPVYMKGDLPLSGSAQQIYERAAALSATMIEEMIGSPMAPVAQHGEPTFFKRRTPSESEIRSVPGVPELYDFIRMLDADGYPKAFLDHAGFRWTFSDAMLEGGKLTARVEVASPGDRV